MVTNFETLDSNLENSELLEIRTALNSLAKDVRESANSKSKESKEKKEKTNLKTKPVDLQYEEKNREKKVTINYPPNNQSVEGKITRCMRWTSITDAVEDRYGIPRGLLMAMMAQEGCGDPTMINKGTYPAYVGKRKGTHVRIIEGGKAKYKRVGEGKGDYIVHTCDGGAGLIHIQAVNAADYGLKTLTRSNNNMRDLSHGDKLVALKQKCGNDLKRMSNEDDRFNPILSVDVSARYLMEYCGGKNAKTGDDWINVIKKYAGRGLQDYGYPVLMYWATINKVRGNKMPKFEDKEVNKVIEGKVSAKVNGRQERVDLCVTRTQSAIDKLEPKIDGKDVSLKKYYKYLKGQCDNYGLGKYTKNNKKHPYVK